MTRFIELTEIPERGSERLVTVNVDLVVMVAPHLLGCRLTFQGGSHALFTETYDEVKAMLEQPPFVPLIRVL